MPDLPGPFPLEEDQLAARIGDLLVARDERVAVSETTAGGLICARMLSVPGASRWFEGGIVPYTGVHKWEALGVDRAIAREYGAVSTQWVAATAEGLLRATEAAWAIAESGIAGPQGSRRSPKPVGSVAIAVAGPNGTVSEEQVFPGSRAGIMRQITERCLLLLEAQLQVEG
jgi:PncC family amidohydrolase